MVLSTKHEYELALVFIGAETWSGNITPVGIGSWTDGEVMRAITSGVRPDDTPLHPLMPSDSYAHLTEPDLHAVVAYVRTLAPIDYTPPEVPVSLPMRLLSRQLPAPYDPPPPPDPNDPVSRGRDLAQIAECSFCQGSDYAGGGSFAIPGRPDAVTRNLTRAPGTRLSGWDRDNFIAVFRSFAGEPHPVPPGEPSTVMPWKRYAGMTDEDLGDLYDYLHSLEPVVR